MDSYSLISRKFSPFPRSPLSGIFLLASITLPTQLAFRIAWAATALAEHLTSPAAIKKNDPFERDSASCSGSEELGAPTSDNIIGESGREEFESERPSNFAKVAVGLGRQPGTFLYCMVLLVCRINGVRIALLVVTCVIVAVAVACVLCCRRKKKNAAVFNFAQSIPAAVLKTAKDQQGIIRPDVMFYQKAVTRKRTPDSSKDGGSGTGSGEDSYPYESTNDSEPVKSNHRDAIIEELALQGAVGSTPEDRLLAAAIAPFKVCSRLTTPTRPLTPAYQPSQPVTVSSVRIVTGNGGEITLPPGYVTYTRDTKNGR